jgi:hypothetical protein
MRTPSFYVAVALCAALCIPTAKAQDLGAALDPVMLGQGLVLSSTMHAHAERDAARLGRKSKRSSRTIRSSSQPLLRGSTRFRPSLMARQRTLASIVARARATDAQGATALERDFANGDPIVAITPALARYGLRTDDVADTTTAYLVSAWYGVRGSNQDPPRAILRATREQVRRALLSTPSFTSSSNAAKQQMSDALLLQLMVTDRLITSAKGNPAQMARAKNTVRQNALRAFKLDLAKMKLTSQGLRA